MSTDGYNIWAGELVRLRPPAPGDAETAQVYAADMETDRLRWIGDYPGPPVADPQNRGDDRRYSIDTFDSKFIGVFNVFRADRHHGRFSYEVALFRPFWGCGYGYDAVRILLRYYFGELGYAKCDIGIYEFNEASLKLHGRVGFVEEGRRRLSLFSMGQRWDEVLLGMTADEFFAAHGDFMLRPALANQPEAAVDLTAC